MVNGNDYFLFDKEKLNSHLEKVFAERPDFRWQGLGLSFVLFGIQIYNTTTQFSNSASLQNTIFYILLFFVLGAFEIVIGIYCWRSWEKYKKFKKNTTEHILEHLPEHEVSHDITDMMVIKRNIENVPHILVYWKEHYGYVIPYSTKHLSAKEYLIAVSRKDSLSQVEEAFASIFVGLQSHAKIEHIDTRTLENLIQPSSDSKYKKFTFSFFKVSEINQGDFLRILKNDHFKNYEWKTINELFSNPMTMLKNGEVINKLNEDNWFSTIQESFVQEDSFWKNFTGPKKVIWNITTACKYKCSFCATNRGKANSKDDVIKNNLSTFQQRIKIADELFNIPSVEIDIAGGDPLSDHDAVEVIFHVLKHMSRNNITITSTGKAFDSLKDRGEELLKLCNRFDMSYDFPSNWGEHASHRGPEYNQENFRQLKTLHEKHIHATVLVTLAKENLLNPGAVDSMLDELSEITPHNITLLRLMPVGKQNYDTYPKNLEEYNPLLAIEKFRKKFGNTIKLHCAFRANLDNGCCNMLTEKIGVDHEGNVFACAWAGYLNFEKISDNPFFLGNLITSGGIKVIFKSKKYTDLVKQISKSDSKGCRIFSYLEDPIVGLTKNLDPLTESFKNISI